MKELIFLTPSFHYRIWGGVRLKEFYPNLNKENIGEAWAISAHENGPSTVLNGRFKGATLDELYKNQRDLFGNIKNEKFPLLIKIIDANDKLSVQVHPDDFLAKKYNSYGKTECWYILDAKENSSIIYGHNALTKEEFITKVNLGKFDDLLYKVPVQKGDFFFIPAGIVHALGEGIMLLEIQQSSDITYRLYDYDRIDKDGKKRELHLQAGIEATKIPSPIIKNQISSQQINSNLISNLIDFKYFSVYKWDLKYSFITSNKPFTLLTILSGSGIINGHKYQKGDSCLVPNYFSKINITPKIPSEIIAVTLPD
ncbi:MAG: class I mannose-6-phosphate isomerase [Acholeplasmataceae bacterium]|nr:class I mannose-6-phosphate isomerase [Acholeplasmataceae bacterium]